MARGRGRPPLVKGEDSIELSVSIEASLYREIGARAAARQMDRNDLVRAVLREFIRKKLQTTNESANLTAQT